MKKVKAETLSLALKIFKNAVLEVDFKVKHNTQPYIKLLLIKISLT
jgi:hypothetical protein